MKGRKQAEVRGSKRPIGISLQLRSNRIFHNLLGNHPQDICVYIVQAYSKKYRLAMEVHEHLEPEVGHYLLGIFLG